MHLLEIKTTTGFCSIELDCIEDIDWNENSKELIINLRSGKVYKVIEEDYESVLLRVKSLPYTCRISRAPIVVEKLLKEQEEYDEAVDKFKHKPLF